MRAMILGLAVCGAMLSACVTPGFEISANEQIDEVERTRAALDADLLAMGGFATYPAIGYSAARCRWFGADQAIAVCRTRRSFQNGPWKPVTVRYRRDDQGRWSRVADARSER